MAGQAQGGVVPNRQPKECSNLQKVYRYAPEKFLSISYRCDKDTFCLEMIFHQSLNISCSPNSFEVFVFFPDLIQFNPMNLRLD